MIKKIEITTLNELFEIKNLLGRNFIYRGHAKGWPLKSTLERLVDIYNPVLLNSTKEFNTIKSFQYRAKNYLSHIPRDDDFFEWLTLLQHHGGATRMVDFTFSFYIAIFFATDNFNDFLKDKNEIIPCIWCINYRKLRKGLPEQLKNNIDKKQKEFSAEYPEKRLFNEYMQEQAIKNELAILPLSPFTFDKKDNSYEFFYENKYSYIIPIVPNNQFPRLAAQRGLFLVPLDITESFEKCLFNNFNINEEQEIILSPEEAQKNSNEIQNSNIIKITLANDKNLFLDILRNLRDMNLTAEYLFPGLDGLAKSSRFTYIINQ